jgi:hypothetical protein
MITIALDNNRGRARSAEKHGIIKVDSMGLRFYPEAKRCRGRTDPQAGPAGPQSFSGTKNKSKKSKKKGMCHAESRRN